MPRKNAVSFEDFDPNVPSSKQPIWAVYTPGTFKTYPVRGHAINRFRHNGQAKLYEWDLSAGRWIERAVKGVGQTPTVCDNCHQPTVEQRPRTEYRRQPTGGFAMVNTGQMYDHNHGRHDFERSGGRLTNPLNFMFLCDECYSVNAHA